MIFVGQSLCLWVLGTLEGGLVSTIRTLRACLARVQSRSVVIELDRAERIRALGRSLSTSTRSRRQTPSGGLSSSSTVTTGKRTRAPRKVAPSSDAQPVTSSTDAPETLKEPSLPLSGESANLAASCSFDKNCTAENPCALHAEWLGAGQQP